MKRYMNLLSLVCLTALMIRAPALSAAERDPSDKRPNFVVILCDDLGYGDLGCYGHPHIRTPNLDRLASQGVRLTDCYSAAPVCSPSRAGLLTGRTPSRVGIYDWIPANHVMHLAPEEKTIATLLRDAGYDTCHVGKWHLNGMFNSPEQPQPGDHGFRYWFSTQNNAAPSHENVRNFVRNGKRVGPTKGYSCQVVADEAIGWLREKRDREAPFFLFVCFHEPHEQIASPPELVETYPEATKRGEALYYANVTNMDLAVGRLMTALDEENLTDDTLVLFTSDNGPETLGRYENAWRSHGSPGPYRGMKLHLYEGGVRVPGIMCFPGHIEPGRESSEVVSSLDILPTFCELAGIEPPHDRVLDGTSFTPLFDEKPVERRVPLFWHYFRSIGEPKAALRDGSWVVLGHWDGPELAPGSGVHAGDMEIINSAKLVGFELYNLVDDPAETRDLTTEEPERLKELSGRLVEMYQQVLSEGRRWNVPLPTP